MSKPLLVALCIPLLCCHAHTEAAQVSGSGGGITPEFRCIDLGFPATVKCGASVCTVTHCGKSKCRYCPKPVPEPLKNLVFKAWATYSCMRASTITGEALGFITLIGDAFVSICLPFGQGNREPEPPFSSPPLEDSYLEP